MSVCIFNTHSNDVPPTSTTKDSARPQIQCNNAALMQQGQQVTMTVSQEYREIRMRVGGGLLCPSSKNGMSFFFSFISNHTNYLPQKPKLHCQQMRELMASLSLPPACLWHGGNHPTDLRARKHQNIGVSVLENGIPFHQTRNTSMLMCVRVRRPFLSAEATMSACPPSETMVHHLFFTPFTTSNEEGPTPSPFAFLSFQSNEVA